MREITWKKVQNLQGVVELLSYKYTNDISGERVRSEDRETVTAVREYENFRNVVGVNIGKLDRQIESINKVGLEAKRAPQIVKNSYDIFKSEMQNAREGSLDHKFVQHHEWLEDNKEALEERANAINQQLIRFGVNIPPLTAKEWVVEESGLGSPGSSSQSGESANYNDLFRDQQEEASRAKREKENQERVAKEAVRQKRVVEATYFDALEQGIIAYEDNKYKAAGKQFEQLKVQPKNVDRIYLKVCHAKAVQHILGRNTEGKRMFESADEDELTTADDYVGKAWIEHIKGNDAEALNIINTVLEKSQIHSHIPDYYDPGYAPAYLQRGAIKAAMGDQRGAIEDYTTVLTLNPEQPALKTGHRLAYFRRAEAYKNVGEDRKAIADYQAALDLQPDFKLAREKMQKLQTRIETAEFYDKKTGKTPEVHSLDRDVAVQVIKAVTGFKRTTGKLGMRTAITPALDRVLAEKSDNKDKIAIEDITNTLNKLGVTDKVKREEVTNILQQASTNPKQGEFVQRLLEGRVLQQTTSSKGSAKT